MTTVAGAGRGIFAGTIALGLHPHPRPPAEAMRLLREEALLAEAAGFDGVGISEHHAGFPAYMPAPLLLAAVLLGDLRAAFAMPSPLLLPLRPAAVVAEELAWLAAIHPGRVGVGVAPGYQRDDFTAAHANFDDRMARFWDGLETLCRALRGEAAPPLGGDAALRACAHSPVEVIAGVGGPLGVRRAARAGAGLLLVSHLDARAARALTDEHAAEGGPAARVLIRRVWVGAEVPGADDLVASYQAASPGGGAWLPSGTGHIIIGSAERIAASLAEAADTAGATALNVRIHTSGTTPEMIREQLGALGAEVLPATRTALGWERARATA